MILSLDETRAGVREGDWKLIWRAPIPPSLELYNIPQDPSEKNNLATQNPDKVAELQKRANEVASTMVKPLFLETEFKATLQRLALPPALPNEQYEFGEEP